MIVNYRNLELIIDNNTTEQLTQFKLLGVWLDNNFHYTLYKIKIFHK